jgi:hypothetical protein
MLVSHFFVESNKEAFIDLMLIVAEYENINRNHNTISIYGEWCGGSIQKVLVFQLT